MRVIGLDLSLASTGVAGIDKGAAWVDRVRTMPDGYPAQLQRLRAVRERVLSYLVFATDLVVVEGLAVASRTGQHLTRAGLWHLVIDAIDARGIAWAEVPPASLKRYATGRGNADKDETLANVLRRFPMVHDVDSNDQADALVLAAMGAHWLGEPLVDMPASHRAALDKVRWPALMSS